MSTFVLTLDLTDHKHPGNQQAQHHMVLQLLDQAKQSIGSSVDREGNLTFGPAFGQKVIGSWKFIDATETAAS